MKEIYRKFGRNRPSYQLKEVLWKKISKKSIFSISAMTILILCCPLKWHFLQIFKIIVESSLIAHSIGNFILKNFNSEHFLIKLISDEIWLYIHIWRHVTSYNFVWSYISSDISFIKKCSELKFFSMKFPIEWAISELSTIILKICNKWHFNGKFEIEIAFAPIEKIDFFVIFFHRISFNW